MFHNNMSCATNWPRSAAIAALFCLAVALPSAGRAQDVPVFEITPQTSTITFFVSSSVKITGKFDKWNSTLVFTSPDATTAVLDIQIQAASVDTGSGMKDSKLKSDDFFDVEKNPLIKFHSTKVEQTGPNTFDINGDFTIRGVTKPEKLSLVVSGIGTGSGTIAGKMTFNRKDYDMNGSIPFLRIADEVDVTVDLKGKRVGGPPVAVKKF